MKITQRILGWRGLGCYWAASRIVWRKGRFLRPFRGLEEAVASGDQAALAKLYSAHPPPCASRQHKLAKLDDEWKFWLG